MILYGRNAVEQAVRGRRRVLRIWTQDEVTAEELERRCGSPDHQGVCAEAGGYPYVSADELLAADEPFVVALDELQDPQNLGAIARTAECAGVTGLVICERRVAGSSEWPRAIS